MDGVASSLGLLLAAIAPGYLMLVFWAKARTWRGYPGDLQAILTSLVLSLFIQVLLSPLTIPVLWPKRDHLVDYPWLVVVWASLALFVVPYIVGTGAAKLSDRVFPPGRKGPFTGGSLFAAWFLRPSPTPSIWDWAVPAAIMSGKFVVIEFKDGTRVSGTWAGPARAFTSPEKQGIYLNEEWLLDEAGNIYARRPDTEGILIPDIQEVRAVRILGTGEVGDDG